MKNAKKSIVIIAILLISCHFALSRNNDQAELLKVNVLKGGQSAICQIQCTNSISYESFALTNPNRLILDLSKVNKISSVPVIQVNDLGILKITVSEYSPDTARVVIYFKNEILKHKISETNNGLNLSFSDDKNIIAPSEEKTPVKVIPSTTSLEQPLSDSSNPDPDMIKDITIGLGGGFFAPQDALIQELYGKSFLNFRAELSYRLPFDFNNLDIWTAFAYYKANGQTSLYQEDTTFSQSTFSLALRYLRKMNRFTPFGGIGIDHTSYKEMFPSNFDYSSVGGSAVGFHIQGGTYIHIIPSLSGKLMIKYNIANTIEDEFDVNLGGISYGISLNFHFDI